MSLVLSRSRSASLAGCPSSSCSLLPRARSSPLTIHVDGIRMVKGWPTACTSCNPRRVTPGRSAARIRKQRAAGETLHLDVLNLASRIVGDVTPKLARATIGSLVVLGALHASPAVKVAPADRIT